MNCYVDTAAIVKLLVMETETAALIDWLGEHQPRLWSSDLLRTEVVRAVRRTAPGLIVKTRELLSGIDLITPTTATFTRAGELEPPELRSLDALHLAAALELGDSLDVMLTYDLRLAQAARGFGIPVVSPTEVHLP